ncbi:MAG TPA: hypothetical protein VIG73_08415 [Cerasibacillus sp.]|uniref:hypothetical protein n=1 Tax=Cerasibacillus sp. TaxID=2498711 RepID=UPI002F414852
MTLISESFSPAKTYLDLNFEEVKKEFKQTHGNYRDYGSILIINEENYSFSVNEFGMIKIFYEDNVYNNKMDKTHILESIKKNFKKHCDINIQF